MLQSLVSIGGLCLAAYVAVCLLVFFRQSSYVYYPGQGVGMTPSDVGLQYENLFLETEDGETANAWFVAAESTDAPVILLCHGNAGDIGDRVGSLETFHSMGLGVLIFDYHGYGKSTGRPGEMETYLDGLAAWKWLVEEKRIAPEKIVVFGRSLGGAVAAWLAVRVSPGALVVESSFSSVPDMGKEMFPFLPARAVCKFRYDTVAEIAKVRCPVLVAHSRHDEMVSLKHGQRIFAAAPEPKIFVEMEGGHNSGGLDVDAAYQGRLRAFIEEHVGTRGGARSGLQQPQ